MKKGFTLVELLAVIVILAVIALITIPAVMKMIDNATTNSYRRSIDLYGRAVNNAIISYQTDMVEKGSSSNVTFENIDPYIEYEGNDVECNNKIIYSDKTILLTECSVDEELVYGEKGKGYGDNNYYYYTNSKKKMKLIEYIKAVEEVIEDKNISGTCTIGEDKITCSGEDINVRSNLENAIEGSLTIENNKVKSYSNLKFETEKKVIKQEEIPEVVDEVITEPDDNSNTQNNDNQNNNNQNNNTQSEQKICKSKTGSVSTELGTEYECEVKEGTKYNFYVLSIDNDKVNLIMDRNICENGYPATAQNTCTYAWYDEIINYTSNANNNYGPVSAMTKLYNATKYWTNVTDMIMSYYDENGASLDSNKGYNSIITNESTKIISKSGEVSANIGTSEQPLKARLPMRSEVNVAGCTTTSETCPIWLVENLKNESLIVYNETNKIDEIYGYWLLSSAQAKGNIDASLINNRGTVSYYATNSNDKYGIRPVISVSISDLS